MNIPSIASYKISQDDQGCQGQGNQGLVSSPGGASPLLFRAERTSGSAGGVPGVAVSGYTRVGVPVGTLPSASPSKLGYGGGLVLDHEAINQAWGDMLDDIGNELGGWDWYTTLTFRDPDEKQREKSPTWSKPGWGYAHKGLREFNKALMQERYGKSQSYWIACMEYQKQRGVPHWHMLMGGLGDERRMDWVDWWYEGYGIGRIMKYDPNLGARYYLGKYLTKEVADVQYSPQLRENHRRAVAKSHHVVS